MNPSGIDLHDVDATTWAPYMRWSKQHVPARFDLTGSNLLPCSVDELPGAREALALAGPNDDGYAPLLEAIATRYGVSAERVCTAGGTSGANFLVMAAGLRPGDEVVVERPAYDPLLGAARLLGATVRRFDRTFGEGFALDPERVIAATSTRTRLVILTNPHNPTGVATPADVLGTLGNMAAERGVAVLVDEVYREALPDPARPPVAATLSDVFLSTTSLTKAYGLSGLRAGWIVGPPSWMERVRRVRDVVDAVGSFPSDVLTLLAFRQIDGLARRARGILDLNLDLLRAFVASRSELEWVPPAGGPVAFPRIRGLRDAGPFVERLFTRFEAGVVPGSFFEAPAHFRVAVGGRRDVLEAGLDRMGRALDEGG